MHKQYARIRTNKREYFLCPLYPFVQAVQEMPGISAQISVLVDLLYLGRMRSESVVEIVSCDMPRSCTKRFGPLGDDDGFHAICLMGMIMMMNPWIQRYAIFRFTYIVMGVEIHLGSEKQHDYLFFCSCPLVLCMSNPNQACRRNMERSVIES